MENRYMAVSSLTWAKYLSEEVEVTPSRGGKVWLSDGSSLELEAGKKVTLKRWQVEELSDYFPRPEGNLSVKEVALDAWKEENDPKKLKNIDPLFYAKASSELRRGEGSDLRASVSELLSIRKRKIMEAAITGRDDSEFYESMTAEERRFYDDLKKCVDGWQDFLVMVLSGMSPLGEAK